MGKVLEAPDEAWPMNSDSDSLLDMAWWGGVQGCEKDFWCAWVTGGFIGKIGRGCGLGRCRLGRCRLGESAEFD